MGRDRKNECRGTYTPNTPLAGSGGGGNPTTFDGRKNRGEKDGAAVGKSSPLRDPKTLHYAPK